MKKPYLKLFEKISDFSVWVVDGGYVRKNIDEEFTNFGQHYRFKFIPKNEFWIDRECSPGEEKFFVEHLLVENKLMSQGKSYIDSVEKADKVEQRERAKSKLMEVKTKEAKKKGEILKLVYKKLLKKYSHKNLKIWIVNGELVRDFFDIDFTEGGHDKVFPFIPKNEIWLDDDLSRDEIEFVLLHEIHERNLMKKSKGISIKNGIIVLNHDYTEVYASAHKSASKMEYFCRHHPKQLEKYLKKELKISLKIN